MQEEMMSMLTFDGSEAGKDTSVQESGIECIGDDSTRSEHIDETEALLEKPAISDLQAVADAFNEAFNTALYDLEFSRRKIADLTARINELDEAVLSIRNALDEEVGKGCRQQEEYANETGLLRQKIDTVESERDVLEEKVCEQVKILEDRASEINELTDRIADLNTTIEENYAAGMRERESYENDKAILNGKLDELQGLYDEAGGRLEIQKDELEEANREIAAQRCQIDSLHAESATKDSETAQLNSQLIELRHEVDAQAESHAAAIEKLNACIKGVTGELETLRDSYTDLQVHAEKLENLNHALHESSVTEKTVFKQQLQEKTGQIEILKSRLESSGKSTENMPDDSQESEILKKSLHDLETRLKEVEAQNQELGIRAEKADKLERLNGRLRIALRKSREYFAENGNKSHNQEVPQGQVIGLQSELDAADDREKDLEARLQGYAAIEEEVINLREAVSKFEGMHPSREDASEVVLALKAEVDRLGTELSMSEERCRRLEATLTTTSEADGTCCVAGAASDIPRNATPPDRAPFIARLDDILARQESSGVQYSLLYVLLDNFSLIRDEVGVMESESVVKAVAKLLETDCKADDLVARFGDCTFAILCSNTPTDEAVKRAGAIREAVEEKIFEYGGRSLVTTTSIGVCSLRRNDVNADDVISRADLACDAARLSGGNRVIVNSALSDEISIIDNSDDYEEIVRSTIAENRIKIYYQPISSLRGQTGNHFEVLVRIVDKNGDMILPGEFFVMAENAGYVNEVDRLVIDMTLKEMSRNVGQQVSYYIKLTRQSVADVDMPDWIRSKIDEYGVAPERLVFEIAEHVLQSDLNHMALCTKALNAIGCKIAIEHYRMSTNMQHLMHVHADYLKIDKGLVASIDKRGGSLAKVTDIMELAAKNNYVTIAEGVESPASLAILWEIGVNMAQGYFIQVPTVSHEYIDHDIMTDADPKSGKAIFKIN